MQSLLDSYFGAGQELAEGDRFLKEYILSKVILLHISLADLRVGCAEECVPSEVLFLHVGCTGLEGFGLNEVLPCVN